MRQTIQDVFLRQAVEEKITVTISQTNGLLIKGLVRSYDQFTILLESENKQYLVYKHAICNLQPAKHLVDFNKLQEEKE